MKLQTMIVAIFVSVVGTPTYCAESQPGIERNAPEAKLFIADDESGKRRLALIQGDSELAAIDLPKRITKESELTGLEEAVWSARKDAVAVAFQNDAQTFVVVFVRTPEHGFKAADISAVEAGNFGKLGRKQSYFHRFKTTPMEWLRRNDSLFQVVVQTKAWDKSGKSQTAREPLIINKDGAPLFR